MDVRIEALHCPSSERFNQLIFDSERCPRGEVLAHFRQALSNVFMPWSLKRDSKEHFEGQLDGLALNTGAFAKVTASPVVRIRGHRELAMSPFDSFYANYVLSGELNVRQGDWEITASRGDLVLYDSARPVILNSGPYEDLAFLFQKTNVESASLSNVLISAHELISPLSSCLTFLSQNLPNTSGDELTALFEACAVLLPLAASRARGTDALLSQPSRSMRELLRYISTNIRDANLSPRSAAAHLGISVRYVHKHFAAIGTTFSAYVSTTRLELIRRKLVSTTSRHQPISEIAYEGGFNDISTFIRAFKKSFGCSPRQYRSKHC